MDVETLKEKTNLSEEENAAIAEDAYKEMDGKEDAPKKEETTEEKEAKKEEKEKKEEGGEPEPKSDEELINAPDDKLSAEELTQKQELIKIRDEEEEKRLLEAKDEDLGDEDKAKKIVIVKSKDDAKKKAVEDEIKAYVEENEVTEEKAKEDIEAINQMIDETGGDVKKLAKSYLHIRQLQSKQSGQLKKANEMLSAPRELTIDTVINEVIDKGKITVNGQKATREQIVEAYRAEHSDITTDVSDEVVLKMAAKDIKSGIEQQNVTRRAELSVKAKEKRSELISALSDKDKQFLPKVKGMIDNLTDAQIMHEDFSLTPYIRYAKGTDREKYGQQRYDEGYKKGKEEAVIENKKAKIGPSDGSTKSKSNKGFKREMSNREQERARDMFDGQNLTEQQMFENYIDLYPKKDEEFKEDSNV